MNHRSSLAGSHMKRCKYHQSTLLHSHMAHWDSYLLYLLYNPYLPTHYHMYTLYHHQLSVHTHRYLHICLLYTSLSLWSDKYMQNVTYCIVDGQSDISTWTQSFAIKLNSKWQKFRKLLHLTENNNRALVLLVWMVLCFRSGCQYLGNNWADHVIKWCS